MHHRSTKLAGDLKKKPVRPSERARVATNPTRSHGTLAHPRAGGQGTERSCPYDNQLWGSGNNKACPGNDEAWAHNGEA